MNFKLEYNNDIHILSQKPSSLSELHKHIRNLYDDLKKAEYFHLRYKDKDGFSITILSEADFSLAISSALDQNLSNLKFFIMAETSNPHFFLKNSSFNPKTPATTCEMQKNKVFLFDNSNTTSSDEKFTGRDSIADKENKEKSFKMIEEPFSFIKLEEEKVLEEKVLEEKSRKAAVTCDTKKKSGIDENSIKDNVFNKLEKFHNVKCYKCNGAGFLVKKSNKKCKKCNGTGDFTNSKKVSIIDYLIKEKLGFIYKEYEEKIAASEQFKGKLFASENINNLNKSKGICSMCAEIIEGRIKYKCLKCPLLTFCEKCEETVDHQHPLMKFKKSLEENKGIFSKSMQLSSRKNLEKNTEIEKNPEKNTEKNNEKNAEKNNEKNTEKNNEKNTEKNTEKNAEKNNEKNDDNFLENSRLLVANSYNYKAKFFSEHFLQNVAIGSEFSMVFTVQNNGDCKWPENMELICISGFYQSNSVGVPSLNINEKHSANLTLQAPKKEEILNSSWRLGYLSRNDKKFFGPKINSTITAMKPEKLAEKEQKEIKKKFMSH